jgi:DNA-binding NarL/FixJ family response regulator
MNTKMRVLVADDHQQCRWAIINILRAEFDVVGAVDDGNKLIDAAISLLPDVIVSDIAMPFLTGIQAMEELHREGYDIPFVLVSTVNYEAQDYVKTGAMAFVNKLDMGQDLIPAVYSAVLEPVCVPRNTKYQRSN